MDCSGQSGDEQLTALLVDDDSSTFALHLAKGCTLSDTTPSEPRILPWP
jgi:hypothetical protein